MYVGPLEYSIGATMLTFSEGMEDNRQCVRVNVNDDDENEGPETVTLTLTEAQLPLVIVPGYEEAVITAIDLDGMIMLLHMIIGWGMDCMCIIIIVSLPAYE